MCVGACGCVSVSVLICMFGARKLRQNEDCSDLRYKPSQNLERTLRPETPAKDILSEAQTFHQQEHACVQCEWELRCVLAPRTGCCPRLPRCFCSVLMDRLECNVATNV